jgi:predicted DNA-binding protein
MKRRTRFDTITDVAYKRTTIFLRVAALDRLKALSRKTGAPVSELIRRGIEMFLDQEAPKKKSRGKPK